MLDQMVVIQLARGVPRRLARVRAEGALERAGCDGCDTLRARELDGAEAMRVAIAGAIADRARLMVVDDPTVGVDLLVRDEILLLLRSLADEGAAILTSSSEATGLLGANRALSLSDGELRGSVLPELAAVVPFRRSA